MVDKTKKKRIEESMKREIGKILLTHPKHHIFKRISITGVDVSPDLATSKVFFSVFNGDELDEAKKVLKEEAWFFRKSLASALNLRLTPKLNFVYDDSLERGQKLAKLIDAAVAQDLSDAESV